MEIQCPDQVQQQPMVVNIVPTQIVRYDMVCRVCGNENDKNVHIFGTDGQNHNLALKMNAYLPIKVADDDNLPSNCCWNCASSILSWHELVVTCAETDKKLKELQIVIAKPLTAPVENSPNEPEVLLSHTPDDTNLIIKDKKTEQLKKKHVCDICNKVFTRNNVLTHHKKRFHTGPDVENVATNEKLDRIFCDLCDKSFTATGSLVRHKRNFHDNLKQRIYRCRSCQAEFKDKTKYFSHIRLMHFNIKKTNGELSKNDLKNHTKLKPERSPRKRIDLLKYKVRLSDEVWYQCDLCENRYKQAYNLARHRSVHVDGSESHVCAICGKQYFTKAGLRRHHVESHTTKRFTCKTCNAEFRAKVSLVQHMNIHSDTRPFACEACGKRFRQDSSLRVHKLYHTTNFRYCCDVCGKRYRRNNELKVHMTLHTGVKPYSCNMCEKAFRLSSTLKQHVKAHARLDECSCDVCGSTFSQMRYLNNHKRCHIEYKVAKATEIKN